MSPKEVHPPKGNRYTGKHKVYANVAKQSVALGQARPGPMLQCYIELADNPFPPGHLPRHHQLKGHHKGTWQYEVGVHREHKPLWSEAPVLHGGRERPHARPRRPPIGAYPPCNDCRADERALDGGVRRPLSATQTSTAVGFC